VIQVTFAIEGNCPVAQLHLTGSVDFAIKSEAKDGESMYSCIDRLQDKLDETLRRRKERWTDHHGEGHWEELERLERTEKKMQAEQEAQEGALTLEEAVDAAYVIHYERARAAGSGSSME
jgi:ribosome-associated translation inhibitor RaiA